MYNQHLSSLILCLRSSWSCALYLGLDLGFFNINNISFLNFIGIQSFCGISFWFWGWKTHELNHTFLCYDIRLSCLLFCLFWYFFSDSILKRKYYKWEPLQNLWKIFFVDCFILVCFSHFSQFNVWNHFLLQMLSTLPCITDNRLTSWKNSCSNIYHWRKWQRVGGCLQGDSPFENVLLYVFMILSYAVFGLSFLFF